MKKYQKWFFLLLCTVFITVSLAACSAKQDTPPVSSDPSSSEPSGQDTSSELSPEEYEAAFKAEPAANRVLRIGYNGGLCQAPIPIAYEKGFFEAEGLTAELTRSESARDAIAGGKIDTSAGMVAEWLKSITNGVDLVFTVGLHTGCTSAIVAADSPITSFEQAKGQVVAISGGIGGTYHNIGYRMIAHDGLKPEDFTWRDFPADQGLQVLQKGEAAIAVVSDQLAEKWVQDGLAKRIRSTTLDDDFINETCCVMGISGDFLRENPITSEKIVRAVYKASLWVEANKKEAAQILIDKGHISGTAEYSEALLNLYQFDRTNDDTEKSIYDSIDEYKALGVLDANIDSDALKNQLWHRFDLDDLVSQ